MTGVCDETLGPGLAAYQQMTDAGTLCALADFDDNIVQLCRGATGAARNQLMEEVDKKMLCALLCCCSRDPNISPSGRQAFQSCVSGTLARAQQDMGGDSRFKPEVSYNMRTYPPEPMMERGLLGGLTTTPIPWNSGGNAHINNRIERDFPGVRPEHGRNTRRPDVVIVHDPSQPPTQDNIANVVEMKFPGDSYGEDQLRAYQDIAGGDIIELDVDTCGCNDDDTTQEQVALVTAAAEARDRQVSLGDRVLSGAGAVLTGIATVGAAALPFDGPVGEVALGGLTAGLVGRVLASSALGAAGRQAIARNAASAWQRLYGSGRALAQ